jgi:spermidine synthase
MKPWAHIATARTPDDSLLELLRHDADYVIRADGYELMTSRMHSSEEAMMRLACPHPPEDASVLVGGLGMGYTAAAALAMLPVRASVIVAELVPAVVEWNRGPLGPLANHPLDDPRTTMVVADVTRVIREASARFDAILLDVDNGPTALTDRGNSWLYTGAGLAAIRSALRPGGGVAIWSIAAEPSFERRLQAAGFTPATHRIKGHVGRGPWHVVFVGRRH